MILEFIKTQEFSAFATALSLLGDIAVLILTIYTLHITAFSKKLEFVSPSFSSSLFGGDQIAITLMNKSLHAIPIQDVFLLKRAKTDEKRCKGEFWFLKIANYEHPIAVDGWSIKRVEMDSFTEIHNWNSEKPLPRYDELFQDAVIGVRAGKKLIWIKPYRNVPLRAAKRAYKKYNYQTLSVSRSIIEGKTVSKAVDCVIYIRTKDANGQVLLRKIFGISQFNGGKSLCLNESICGYNALPCPGNTAEEIVETIHKSFGIAKKDLAVQMIGTDWKIAKDENIEE